MLNAILFNDSRTSVIYVNISLILTCFLALAGSGRIITNILSIFAIRIRR